MFLALVMTSILCQAANDATSNYLEVNILTPIRQRQYVSVSTIREALLHVDEGEIFSELESIVADEDPQLRERAIGAIQTLDMVRDTPASRQRAVSILVAHLADADPGIRRQCYNLLLKHRAVDFDVTSKQRIREYLQQPKYYRFADEALRVAGVAGLSDQLSLIQRLGAQTGGTIGGLPWTAALVCARLGDDAAEQIVMGAIRSIERSPDRRSRLFGDLSYMRSPKAISYLIGQLDSNERTRDLGDDAPGVPVSRLALSSLADCFIDFPLEGAKSHGYGLSDEEMRSVKIWLGDWHRHPLRK